MTLYWDVVASNGYTTYRDICKVSGRSLGIFEHIAVEGRPGCPDYCLLGVSRWVWLKGVRNDIVVGPSRA